MDRHLGITCRTVDPLFNIVALTSTNALTLTVGAF